MLISNLTRADRRHRHPVAGPGASSLFVIGAAFGEPAKQDAVDTATLHAATVEKIGCAGRTELRRL